MANYYDLIQTGGLQPANPTYSDQSPHRVHHYDHLFTNPRLSETYLFSDYHDGYSATELYPNVSNFLMVMEQIAKGTTTRPWDFTPQERRSGRLKKMSYVKEALNCEINVSAHADIRGLKLCSPFLPNGKKVKVPIADIAPTGTWDTLFVAPKDYYIQNDDVILRVFANPDGQGTREISIGATVMNIPVVTSRQAGTFVELDLKVTHVDGLSIDRKTSLTLNELALEIKKGAALVKSGNSYAEGSEIGDGRGSYDADEIEMSTQIFKNQTRKHSGTEQATKYNRKVHPRVEAYEDMIKEHILDMARAIMLNGTAVVDPNNKDMRRSHGLIAAIKHLGGFYDKIPWNADNDNLNMFFNNWADDDIGLDKLLDENGVINAWTSKNMISWFKGMGNGSLTSNIFEKNPYLRGIVSVTQEGRPFQFDNVVPSGDRNSVIIDLQNVTLNLHAEPILSTPGNNNLVIIPNLSDLSWDYLGEGAERREQIIERNRRNGSEDATFDTIMSECGLRIGMPETHAIIEFEGGGSNYYTNKYTW